MSTVNIMVVDDELDVGELTKEICIEGGYETIYCSDSHSAIKTYEESPTSIVVLDIDLKEERTGIDLIPLIKKVNPHVYVLMLTGEHDIKASISALRAGAFDYILKPFDPRYLIERLKQVEDLILSEKLKQMYLHAMVHDLKNPITNVKILMDSFKFNATKTEKIKQLSQLGKTSVIMMENIVKNILSLEKISQGKYSLKNEEFDIKEFIEEFFNVYSLLFKKEKVVLDIDDHLGVINIDKNLYCHILMNIVSNAMKYSAHNEKIEIMIQKKDQQLLTSVKNIGSFIPEKDRLRVFKLFYQRDNEASFYNFGMGLSFCQSAVEVMKGEIKIGGNEKENSTTFTFSVLDHESAT